jgi:hypothetical protein
MLLLEEVPMPRKRKLFGVRRSKKIAPGVRVTLTKKGPGMSVKIPGVGSYSTRTGKIRKKKGCGLLMLLLGTLIITIVLSVQFM